MARPRTQHRLDPSPQTVVDVLSRDARPVLTVDPGDRLVVRSLDASGHLSPQRSPATGRTGCCPTRGATA